MTTSAESPENDASRVQALRDLQILDTLPEQGYDDLALLASRICGTPIALISLVDGDRQWVKAKVGLDVSEIPRNLAFCGHAILEPNQVFIVHDAQADDRFAANPLVTDGPRVRAYAGAPIVMRSGEVLGTVCVIDTSPRTLTAEQAYALQALARQAAGQFELRRANLRLEAAVATKTQDLQVALKAVEAAGRVKSAFVSAMSHEIRTPLNGVMGMIDVLQQGRLEGLQQEAARMARESADALRRIIDDVLEFSRIDTGTVRVEQELMSIENVVVQAHDALAPVAKAKRCGLSLHVDSALSAQVRGDAMRLRQILVHLIDNAIKFSSGVARSGDVQVLASLANGNAERCPIQISVTDNGVGMDAATQARLFVPFTQADAGTTKEFGGAGLGLTISQRLAKLMGGDLAVESELGKGSRFTLHLPFQGTADQGLDVQASPAQAPVPTSPSDMSERPILVAEDNEMNQHVIRHQLSILGLSADIAETGRVALDMLARKGYALLLTDLHMPVMDGFELVARIRNAEPRGARLPIVALTADASETASARCRQLGVDECMTKPVSLVDLRAVLEKRLPAEIRPLALNR